MGRYRVQLYEDEQGRCPICEWLDELYRRHPRVWAVAQRLLKSLREQGPDLVPPKTKSFRYKKVLVYELRQRTPQGAVRIYYWRQASDLFVVVAGEVKKEDDPDKRLLDLLVRAYRAWNEVN